MEQQATSWLRTDRRGHLATAVERTSCVSTSDLQRGRAAWRASEGHCACGASARRKCAHTLRQRSATDAAQSCGCQRYASGSCRTAVAEGDGSDLVATAA